MDILFLVLIFAALVALIVLMVRRRGPEPKDGQSLLLLQNQINEISRTLDTKLGESTRVLQRQFGESSKLIKEITQELTKVGEGQRQVVDVAKQLENLQDILKNTKQRGNLGEYSLELILQNFFPNNYEKQYEFNDGSKVDFVLKVKDKLIPIDSKFSLENYQRVIGAEQEADKLTYEEAFKSDLKKRIDETSKYIKPSEGTTEFAFMFIPAEAIYYDLLVNKVGALKSNTVSLIEYAMAQKHVVIVSPSSFLAYLETVIQGLKALQVEESAKEIIKRVAELGRHLSNYDAYMQKLGNHLGTTVGTYNKAYKELGKVDKDVLRISGEAASIEPLAIEPPESDEQG